MAHVSSLQADQSDKHYTIAVFLSAQEGSVSQTLNAIRQFTSKRIAEINKHGGIAGRPVRLLFLDDNENPDKTILNVQKALTDKNLIAMLGLWSSTRGSKVIESIGRSNIPFISEISLDALFAPYPNIFSLSRSVSDDLAIFDKFLKDNYSRVSFVGAEGDLFTAKFHQKLLDISNGPSLVSTHWISENSGTDQEDLARTIAEIKEAQADIITLAVGSNKGGRFLQELERSGITTPIFVATGSILRILRNIEENGYHGALYQTRDSIPNMDNERLAALKRRPEFETAKKPLANDDLAYGIIYADMLSMISETKLEIGNNDIIKIRQKINDNLKSYVEGKKVFRGLWRDWSFTPDRTSAESTFILWRPEGGGDLKLWPTQYFRTSEGLSKVPVIYSSLDMKRIFRIDSNEKSFDAEFYFSLKSDQDIDIESIEFTNALRSDSNESPLLNIREIHDGKSEKANLKTGLKLYKISGRFLFDPDLKNYPFDRQRFVISFQPINTASPFLVQPPPASLRDRDFEIDGWKLIGGAKQEYVGSDQDIISVVQDYVSNPQILSFYKFNFTWLAHRQALDYYLRVVIPLTLIMIVAYFSIFLPNAKFESVISIQVTALLSTIALYLAIPKLDTETATLSDQIFVFTEIMVGLLIALSIMKIHTVVKKAQIVGNFLTGVMIIVFPVIAFLMLRYVYAVSNGSINSISGRSASEIFSILRKLI